MISFIIMASGLSRRFGENKLLFKPFENRPMIENIFKILEDEKFEEDEKIVVYKDLEIKRIADKFNFKSVENRRYTYGKSESIKCGVRNASDETEGFMFLVGDQPFISRETIKRLKEKGIKEKNIVVPIYKDNYGKMRRGNPIYFPRKFKKELLNLTSDDGGINIIEANKEKIIFYEVGSSIEFFDIDTKEDLIKLKGDNNERDSYYKRSR